MSDSRFASADLSGVTITTGVLHKAVFTEADLSGASFEDVELQGSVFIKADLTGATGSAADIWLVNSRRRRSWMRTFLGRTATT